MVTLFILQACSSMHTLQGAKTIEPKTWEVAVGASMQQNNPISLSTKLPVPQMILSTRYGLKPNLDVGTQVYLGGGALDFRYQFAQVNDWHLAIAPTITGLYAGVYGNLSYQIPIRAQTSLNDNWDLMIGFTPTTQQFSVHLDPLNEVLVTSAIGNTIRLERHGKKVRWGYTLDSRYTIGRNGPIGISGGIDMSWIRQSKKVSP